ncbi:MAG: hypothetical protein HY927_06330 [Elusimicrobia bacterium]|nr:hypothetical protein [Elusimicrobiota bacterium]
MTAMTLLLTGLLALPAPGVSGEGVDPGSPVLLKAMKDELKRTMARLDMGGLGTPYFVSYTARDVRRIEVEGSFGAIKDFQDERSRRLKVDLRVGNASFDNTHYVERGGWRFGPDTESIVVDDDYDALRFDLWSATDRVYKEAHETLSKKKAYKQRRLIKEELPDLSADPADTSLTNPTVLSFDRAAWEENIRKLSAVFKAYPVVQRSEVSLFWTQQHLYVTDSQSRDVVKDSHDVEVYMEASAQAPDGMKLSDRRRVIRQDPASLPPYEALEAEAQALAKDLTALAAAPNWEDPYTGPVLLQGQAAGQFFDQLLARNLSFPRSLWLEDEERMKPDFHSGSFASRLGLRVVSPILSVYDDPTLREFGGTPLAGYYKVDDEGIRARKVDLIERGTLKDLLMGRSPVKERNLSNGHGRGAFEEFPTAHIGNLVIKADKTAGDAELKEELLKAAKAFGLDYGVVIRRIFDEAKRGENDMLAAPALVYKVYVKDGREELLRNAQFTSVTLRALRDIALAGSAEHVFNYYQLGPYRYARGEVAASIVHPDVLVAELELKRSEEKPDKPPVLGHPYFSK